jgi:diguanylate cyclase
MDGSTGEISTDHTKSTDRNGLMRYDHSLEKASEYLRMTLGFLGKYNLPGDPVNYTVWYEYASKNNPHLISAVEESLNESQPITPELTNSWFEEHVVFRGQALIMGIKMDLLKILREVFGDLSTAGDELSLFEKCLAQYSERIEQAEDNETLQESLRGLLLAVKNVEASSATLERRLKSADEEVKSLQIKLKEAEQHATTDALTGLWNRRSFEDKLAHHMTRCQQTEGDLSLVMLDIDHFKQVNDTYGHLTGDDLLRIIAKTLRDYVKGKDIVCRYGGEEFVILLPDTPLIGAVTVAENIRKHFSQMSWKQKRTGASMGKVTLSAGVSSARSDESMETFVQRADVALYQSKKMGRNRVTAEKQ